MRAVPATRRLAPALTVLAVGALVAWNLDFYFREYTPRNNFGGRPTESATAIGRHLAAHPGRYRLLRRATVRVPGHRLDRLPGAEPLGYDVPQPVPPEGLPPPPAGREPLVIFAPPRADEAAAVWRRHPGSPVRTYRSDVDGRPLFSSYTPSSDAWPPPPELGRGHTQWGETGSGQSVALNSSHCNGATRRYTRTGGWS